MYSEKLETNKIVATLEWGIIFPIWLMCIMGFLIVSMCLGVTWLIIDNIEDIMEYIGLICFMTILISSFTALVIFNSHHRKMVKLWLNDAMEVTVKMSRLSEIEGQTVVNGVPVGGNLSFKVKIHFDNGTLTLTSNSRTTMDGKRKIVSFCKPLLKYCNRPLQALYSPKYKQLIFIKQSQNNVCETKEIL